MRILILVAYAISTIWLAEPALQVTGGKAHWERAASFMMHTARYKRQHIEYPPNFRKIHADEVIVQIVESEFYADKNNFDLLKHLPPLKGETEQDRLEELNTLVNHSFKYYSGPMNYWYAEPPLVSALLGAGDCKSYAYYKYWLLRQMGYTNVKLVTVVLPDGAGDLAGHVVVVLNDLWVLDINPPYYYPFEVLRENTGLDEAFFPDGSIWDVK